MQAVKISPKDNVAVALTSLSAGEKVLDTVLREDIPAGHKFALSPIHKGENAIKYGFPIGHASAAIQPGDWVHTHNLGTNLEGVLEYCYQPVPVPQREGQQGNFKGFVRRDGRVGIRNEIWIIPTVGCVNSPAEIIARESTKFVHGSIDGVYAFPHPYGCSQLGDDQLYTQKVLAGLARHPNAGGILILGLGCENNHIDAFRKVLGPVDKSRVRFLNCQDVFDEIQTGTAIVQELCTLAGKDERQDVPLSQLVVGLKCGGSDGLSGITANPAVGAFSDLLVYGGGSAILTEVPEMFGAENLLMQRCESRECFEQTAALINGFKEYFLRYGQAVYENPSPGNKAGGITTLEDKSLGCTQKSGTAAVSSVIAYGEPLQKKGLTLLSAPGNDLIASTALAVSGAQLVLFTTGRGTPFGCPVPTVKISSNTALAQKKPNWIDFDAGVICETGDIAACGSALFDYVLKLASGEIQTNNERVNMRSIAIFKDGVTL